MCAAPSEAFRTPNNLKTIFRLYFQVYFPTSDKLSSSWANWGDRPPDIHAHCPSCSGTHRLSLLLTSLPPHAETHFNTVPQHLPIRQMNTQFQKTKPSFRLVCGSQPSHRDIKMC